LWDAAEYAKLPRYDAPTMQQPPVLFLCHLGNQRICGGWAGCHNTDHLLALRLAIRIWRMHPVEVQATHDYVPPVPLFASGREAAAHGLAAIAEPTDDAWQVAYTLRRKVALRGLAAAVATLPVPQHRPTATA
jgi:hypothetical protein